MLKNDDCVSDLRLPPCGAPNLLNDLHNTSLVLQYDLGSTCLSVMLINEVKASSMWGTQPAE